MMDDCLPIYSAHRASRSKSRGILGYRSRRCCHNKMYVHATPLIVLLAFFILYWFSSPVIVEVRDGRIEAIYSVDDMPLSLNKTHHVNLAVLAYTAAAAAASPTPSNIEAPLNIHSNRF